MPGLCLFLAYATTSSVGRGRRDAAVSEGVEGLALGLGPGAPVGVPTRLLAEPAVVALGASPEVVPWAVACLHVVALGFPAALAAMTGVGVLRGPQHTPTTLLVTLVAVTATSSSRPGSRSCWTSGSAARRPRPRWPGWSRHRRTSRTRMTSASWGCGARSPGP